MCGGWERERPCPSPRSHPAHNIQNGSCVQDQPPGQLQWSRRWTGEEHVQKSCVGLLFMWKKRTMLLNQLLSFNPQTAVCPFLYHFGLIFFFFLVYFSHCVQCVQTHGYEMPVCYAETEPVFVTLCLVINFKALSQHVGVHSISCQWSPFGLKWWPCHLHAYKKRVWQELLVVVPPLLSASSCIAALFGPFLKEEKKTLIARFTATLLWGRAAFGSSTVHYCQPSASLHSMWWFQRWIWLLTFFVLHASRRKKKKSTVTVFKLRMCSFCRSS